MKIKDKYLNSKLDVLRASTKRVTESGDISRDSLQTIMKGVPGRITTAASIAPGGMDETGISPDSTHMLFINPGLLVEIEIDDLVVDQDDGQRYKVTWINRKPGGVVGHHTEVYLTRAKSVSELT